MLHHIRSSHKSEVEKEITETLQEQVIQREKNLAEFYFTVDFWLTKFGGDYGMQICSRRTHIWRRIQRSTAAEGLVCLNTLQ